jgi:hypothetical protein
MPRPVSRRATIFLSCVAAVCALCVDLRDGVAGEASAPIVDFARDVFPILKRSCFECHGPRRREAGLRLDRRDDFLKGGDNGPVVVAGSADRSELHRRVTRPPEDAEIMPARGKPLSDAQAVVLRDWINHGAVWPATFQEAPHWAYVKPARPPLPATDDARWSRNAIDRFIKTRIDAAGLRPSPEADPAVLLRRVSLDLIGLPPTPAEVDALLADDDPDAYAHAVDRLLAAPEFGERWARPWLDAARYADSHGFQRDDLREIWPYRDWVIQALNQDMPFDRFTREQIAGDLLAGATQSQKVATGFNRCAPTNCEAGSDPEETRVNQVLDRVNTTAAVWLGSTLECAQCHDHKFDPFTQRDYYGLFAYFNNTALEADRANPKVPGSIRFLGPSMPVADPAHDADRARLNKTLKELQDEIESRTAELRERLNQPEAADALLSVAQVDVLDIDDFESSAGAPHKMLDDRSILLVDDAPDVDTYTVTARTTLTDITGFKLETLVDPTLPGMGPGRGDPERPNFVLNTFAVTIELPGGGPAVPVSLQHAQADFSQANYNVAGAIDNDAKTAWAIAPKFHESHWATFETVAPIGSKDGATLTFKLVQHFGRGRTIGRFRLSALTGKRGAPQTSAEIVQILKMSPDKRSPDQTRRLLDACIAQDDRLMGLQADRANANRQLAEFPQPTTQVMQELAAPRPTAIFLRGDFRMPGASVEAGTPAVISPAATGPANRLTLADWLIHRENPLTARVTVNRLWNELFGRGIVTTVEDFGVKGEPPTHPELLDWLAVEFMENGWSIKRLLKTIVTSATYRQASHVTAELLAKDDRNQWYARGPRFRMDAEMIRDNALAVAGLLSRERGGPPIRPYQPEGLWAKVGGQKIEYVISPGEQRHRRGVYVVWKRAAPYPSFVNFDATARLTCKLKRNRSNTPLQALTLLNDPVYVEAASALARRVVDEPSAATIDERLRQAFRLCLARAPRTEEVALLRRLFDAQLAASQNDPQSARTLAAELDLPKGLTPSEFAAWYVVAAALLNLDETITKG